MKINSVQYLRGLAAVLVLIAHAFEHQIAGESFPLLRLGSFGVVMFFVISGFIMVFISGENPFDAFGFLRRRVVRVVPLYWLATSAVAILALAAPALLRRTTFAPGDFVLSLLFVPHYDDAGGLAPMLTLGWTLNYEMFFYICFAAVSFLAAGTRVATITAVFAVLVALGQTVDFINPLLQFYTRHIVGAFCIGMWLGLATIRGWSLRGRPGLQVAAAMATVALIAAGFLVQPGTRGDWSVTYAFALGSAALLILAIGVEERLPVSRMGLVLGDASYSLYLSHMYAVAAAILVMRRLGDSQNLVVNGAVAIMGGLVLGLLVHRLVEKPLLALLQRPRRSLAVAPKSALAVPIDGEPPALLPIDAPGSDHLAERAR